MGSIKVMLVDDHAVVRAGYRFLLENEAGIEVVAEAGSAEAALAQCSSVAPDILVLDLSMPGLGGMAAIRRLRTACPDVKVLVFTMHENTAFVERALEAGVAGYISKNSAPEILVTAVRRIAGGQSYVDAELAQRMVVQHTREQGSLFAGLSTREFQILCMFAEARATDEIARELSLSNKTVANYLSQIKEKLQVNSTPELVRLALSQGLATL